MPTAITSSPDAPLARASLARLVPAYDSKAEEWWAAYGALLLGDEIGCPVALTKYHPWTLHIPGGNYTPDFTHYLNDGRIVIVEVKGSQHQRGYRDARSKLRAAAALFGEFIFYEARIGKVTCEALELIGGADDAG